MKTINESLDVDEIVDNAFDRYQRESVKMIDCYLGWQRESFIPSGIKGRVRYHGKEFGDLGEVLVKKLIPMIVENLSSMMIFNNNCYDVIPEEYVFELLVTKMMAKQEKIHDADGDIGAAFDE